VDAGGHRVEPERDRQERQPIARRCGPALRAGQRGREEQKQRGGTQHTQADLRAPRHAPEQDEPLRLRPAVPGLARDHDGRRDEEGRHDARDDHEDEHAGQPRPAGRQGVDDQGRAEQDPGC
jgi:hypothetical protein